MLRIYTRLRLGRQSDPSLILLENFTPRQTSAQEVLDEMRWNGNEASGELVVLIPFRDRWDLTATCLKSLGAQDLPPMMKLRTILLDNRSSSNDTALELSRAAESFPNLAIEIVKADYEFNYSRINNDGFRQSRNENTRYVLFLNNDVELVSPNVIRKMIAVLTAVPEVGVVGTTLLFPNQKIQHLFAAPGVKIIAAHPLKGESCQDGLGWFSKPVRPVPAVTGALMMLRSQDFEEVGFFDESLPTMAQDIDLCLGVFYNCDKISVAITSCEVIHHESATKKIGFCRDEVLRMRKKWGHRLYTHPLYSNKFSRYSERPLIKIVPELPYPTSIVVPR